MLILKVDLDERKIIERVTNDRFGLFVSNEWKRLINPYTPKDNGILMQSALLRPFEIEYIENYAHYVYMGELYVDPVTGSSFAGFGVTKIPAGKSLQYQKNNPYATDHWDIKAAEAGQLSKLYRTLNAGLDSGRF